MVSQTRIILCVVLAFSAYYSTASIIPFLSSETVTSCGNDSQTAEIDNASPITITVDFTQNSKDKVKVFVKDIKAPKGEQLLQFDSSRESRQTKTLKPLNLSPIGGDKENTVRKFEIRVTHNDNPYCLGVPSDGFVLESKGNNVFVAEQRSSDEKLIEHVTIKLASE